MDAIVLPVDIEDEVGLLSGIAGALSEMGWLFLSTYWQLHGGSPVKRLNERFHGLVGEPIAHSTIHMPESPDMVWEMNRLDQSSQHIHEVATFLRQSRGRASCLALSPEGASWEVWQSAALAIVWRAAMQPRRNAIRGHGDVDRAIMGLYFSQIAENGLIAVVPLDIHPYAGCAFLGGEDAVRGIASRLAGVGHSASNQDMQGFHKNAGGLAL